MGSLKTNSIFVSDKDYLEISKSSEIKNLGDRVLFRFFEILPGFLSWITLIAAFVLSWLQPLLVAFFILTFDFYWLLKVAYFSFCQVSSYRKMKKHLKIGWMEKLENLKSRDIYHLVILPMYKEGIDIVRSTCRAIESSTYPKDKIIIVLAIEERAGVSILQLAKDIEKEFGQKFFQFLITIHPKDLPIEIKGKGSNGAWAIKQARKLIASLEIPSEDIIVSNFDIDTKVYSQYFACLTWHYLTAEKPLRSSYQPIPVYNNNIWDAPAFSRVIACSSTFWQMMQQERQEKLVSYSAHAIPFKVFEDIDYPSNVVSDDSRIFWKAYLYYDGDYRMVPLYYPVSMDAVTARTLFRTAINQYKQQLRWAWGCIEIPYLLYGFFKNKKIPFKKKFSHGLNIIEGYWSWVTSTLLIFLLGWLPLILGGDRFNFTVLSYNLPRLTGYIMTFAMFGMILGAIISLLLLPPRPARFSKYKNLSILLQWLLLPITLIFFGALPALEAQTRLILGKRLSFWPTEKTRQS